MPDVPRPRPPYLHREHTRHGSLVWYVRRERGPRVRLRSAYDTAAFWAEYRAAIEGVPPSLPFAATPRPHTLAWAIDRYRNHSAWTTLAYATRKQRGSFLQKAVETAGHEPLIAITQESIRQGRENRSAKPHSANNFLKAMRGFFRWAVEDGLIPSDPTTGVLLLKGTNDDVGFHTWTEEEVERFETHWPIGTRQRLAFDVLLYTGLRRGDAVRLGRQHIREGVISLRMEKTGEQIFLPVLPVLAASIAATKTGDLALLATERGQPFGKESFGNWFRKACQEAGCPGSAHGLRKAGATRAAENGATERELMAIFGWTTGKMATHYTQAADRKRLAMQASGLLISTKNARTSILGAGVSDKTLKKSGS